MGEPEVERLARAIADDGRQAAVLLVTVPQRDSSTAAQEQLRDLWQACTAHSPNLVHGRRLSWRSFFLLVEGPIEDVRRAIEMADAGGPSHEAAANGSSTLHSSASSGDLMADIRRLESQARPDR